MMINFQKLIGKQFLSDFICSVELTDRHIDLYMINSKIKLIKNDTLIDLLERDSNLWFIDIFPRINSNTNLATIRYLKDSEYKPRSLKLEVLSIRKNR